MTPWAGRIGRAERLGEITKGMEKASAGRHPQNRSERGPISTPTKAAALESVGIAKQDASRFEAIAAVPAATFEREVVKPEARTPRMAGNGQAILRHLPSPQSHGQSRESEA